MQSHISLYVSDLDSSLKFYSAFLGEKPAKVKPKYGKYQLENPQLVLSLVENPQRAHGGFGHLGIVVENSDAVEHWMKQAKERGVDIALVEKGTRCCYARQDKFWVKDPDGVQWEVYTFHEDSEWNDPEYSDVPQKEIEVVQDVCCAG